MAERQRNFFLPAGFHSAVAAFGLEFARARPMRAGVVN